MTIPQYRSPGSERKELHVVIATSVLLGPSMRPRHCCRGESLAPGVYACPPGPLTVASDPASFKKITIVTSSRLAGAAHRATSRESDDDPLTVCSPRYSHWL